VDYRQAVGAARPLSHESVPQERRADTADSEERLRLPRPLLRMPALLGMLLAENTMPRPGPAAKKRRPAPADTATVTEPVGPGRRNPSTGGSSSLLRDAGSASAGRYSRNSSSVAWLR
jgi:hypothetical protein